MPDTPDTALVATGPQGSGTATPLARAQSWLNDRPLVRRAALPATIAAVIAAVLIGWLVFSAPARAPLYRSLPDSDKAAVVAALQEAGMAVALDPSSGAVMLPPDDHARARMLLAAEGLPRAAPGGMDMLSDMPMGASRAVEGARLKSAQERELARSIESLQGVDAALVIIAVPDPSPFVRERAPVTASVTVTLAQGRALSEGQARAIAHLVAGAVPGLSIDHVAIADQTGRLLSGDPNAGKDSVEDQRLQMQARIEQRAREAILALLVPMVGADKVTAQVAVELDFAAREAAREQYDREPVVRSESTSRRTDSTPRAIGIPGALTNTVPAAATVGAQPPPGVAAPTEQASTEEQATRNYEIGRSLEVTMNRGGTIRRLTAAVAISADALGPPAGRAATLREIEALVASAIGASTERGDTVKVAARPFLPPADVQIPIWREPVVVESSKWLAFGLIGIVALLFLVRPVLKQLLAKAPGGDADGVIDGGEAYRVGVAGAAAAAALPPVDYTAKLQEARLLAATDTARAAAVARRLLADAAS